MRGRASSSSSRDPQWRSLLTTEETDRGRERKRKRGRGRSAWLCVCCYCRVTRVLLQKTGSLLRLYPREEDSEKKVLTWSSPFTKRRLLSELASSLDKGNCLPLSLFVLEDGRLHRCTGKVEGRLSVGDRLRRHLATFLSVSKLLFLPLFPLFFLSVLMLSRANVVTTESGEKKKREGEKTNAPKQTSNPRSGGARRRGGAGSHAKTKKLEDSCPRR